MSRPVIHRVENHLYYTENHLHHPKNRLHRTEDQLHHSEDGMHDTKDGMHDTKDGMHDTKDSMSNTENPQSHTENNLKAQQAHFRKRVVFSASQLEGLDKEFRSNKYPNKPRRVTLSQSLGLSEYQVQIWFQNRRQRYKEEQARTYHPL